jgi:hypothetical protein
MSLALEKSFDTISFVVETLIVRNGKKLKRLTPDEHGYYGNFPIAVIGGKTRNDTFYEAPEFLSQIQSEKSYFNMMLRDGTLYGELGHPKLDNMSHQEQLNRLVHIDESRVSHHFRKVTNGEKLSSGGTIVLADIKPHGEKGYVVKENLSEPYMNTSFSLRSITQDRQDPSGVLYRKMRKLITFDYVLAGGYEEASKRYIVGNEGVRIKLDPANDIALLQEVALEHFTMKELSDIFGTKQVLLHKRQVTVIKGSGLFKENGENMARSIYHELIK